MLMKIKELGMKRAIKIKHNIHNQKVIQRVQLAILKMQDDHSDDMTPLENIQNEINLTEQLEDFLRSFLKIKDEQVEKIEEDLSPEELGAAIGEVVMRFNGATDADVKEAFAESEKEAEEVKTDPLKEGNDSEKSA